MARWIVTVTRHQTTVIEVEADDPDAAIAVTDDMDFDALTFDPGVEAEYTVGPVEST